MPLSRQSIIVKIIRFLMTVGTSELDIALFLNVVAILHFHIKITVKHCKIIAIIANKISESEGITFDISLYIRPYNIANGISKE